MTVFISNYLLLEVRLWTGFYPDPDKIFEKINLEPDMIFEKKPDPTLEIQFGSES